MGASVWTFLRPRPGHLQPVTQRALDAFISDGGWLPVDADGFVRYAQVIVHLEDRRATEVLRVGFYQHRALENGTLDHRHFRKVMATIPDVLFGGLQLEKPAPGVVAAEHRFAKRRLAHLSNWQPTPDELSKLRKLVNEKAGREIM
jgi:hypothetical protein